MRDIFVVSNDRRNFETFMAEASNLAQYEYEIRHRMIHYVDHPSELATMPSRVFLLGSYFKRKDWFEIERVIVERGHRSLLIR